MIHVALWYHFPVLRYTSLLLLNVGSVKVSGNHFILQTLIQKKNGYSGSNLLGHLGRQFPLVLMHKA